jgi:hypothetical protein
VGEITPACRQAGHKNRQNDSRTQEDMQDPHKPAQSLAAQGLTEPAETVEKIKSEYNEKRMR